MKKRTTVEFCKETHKWADTYSGSSSKIPIMDIDDRLRAVERRLCILEDNSEIRKKFPILENAYNEYKLIEKLVLGEVSEKDY